MNLKVDRLYEPENYLVLPTMYNKLNLQKYAWFRANLLGCEKYYNANKNINLVCTLCDEINSDINKHLYCNCEVFKNERKAIFGTEYIHVTNYHKAFNIRNDFYMQKVVKLIKVIIAKTNPNQNQGYNMFALNNCSSIYK